MFFLSKQHQAAPAATYTIYTIEFRWISGRVGLSNFCQVLLPFLPYDLTCVVFSIYANHTLHTLPLLYQGFPRCHHPAGKPAVRVYQVETLEKKILTSKITGQSLGPPTLSFYWLLYLQYIFWTSKKNLESHLHFSYIPQWPACSFTETWRVQSPMGKNSGQNFDSKTVGGSSLEAQNAPLLLSSLPHNLGPTIWFENSWDGFRRVFWCPFFSRGKKKNGSFPTTLHLWTNLAFEYCLQSSKLPGPFEDKNRRILWKHLLRTVWGHPSNLSFHTRPAAADEVTTPRNTGRPQGFSWLVGVTTQNLLKQGHMSWHVCLRFQKTQISTTFSSVEFLVSFFFADFFFRGSSSGSWVTARTAVATAIAWKDTVP